MDTSRQAPGPIDPLMDFKAVSAATCQSEATIRRMMARGAFPLPAKLGRINVWRASVIKAWIDEIIPPEPTQGVTA